jgi:hypothetical protein
MSFVNSISLFLGYGKAHVFYPYRKPLFCLVQESVEDKAVKFEISLWGM